ncbi:MAG: hypothetical protein ABIT71_23760 [Vicinamibacteraceae bacterium]
MKPAAIALVSMLVASPAAAQHTPSAHDAHHTAVDARGAAVMGFDQGRTVHHFRLYEDGGAIDVAVIDGSDAGNRDAIRQHLPHIAALFADGRFDAPMLVHATDVPGTKELSALKAGVRYRYVETPGGGRVDIVTTQPDALEAVHRFLAFQIADHRTGDDTAVGRRP